MEYIHDRGVWLHTQATDDELMLAHTESHVRHIDGPPKGDEWLIGDNYYSPLTPVAARMAAGCTVQVYRIPSFPQSTRSPEHVQCRHADHAPLICTAMSAQTPEDATFSSPKTPMA